MLYEPGVCNIGKNEIKKRYELAVSGFFLTALLFFLLYFYNFSAVWFVVLFVPLMFGFEGLYQGYLHFCAGFGMSGKYDFSGTKKEHGLVKDKQEHMRDMVKSMQINAYSVWSAVLVTILLMLLKAFLH